MTRFVVAGGKIDERASFLASPFFPAKKIRNAISFNLSMARYPSQRRFESRERVSKRFSWPEKRGHILTTAVLSLSWERLRREPFVFRMPLLPRSVLPIYPSAHELRNETGEVLKKVRLHVPGIPPRVFATQP